MVRLVALDLDDTLLTTDKQVSEGNKRALKACQDAGIRVVTASGRFNESQLVLIKRIGLGLESEAHVGDGGGTIFSEAGVSRIMGAFKKETYEDILRQTRALNLPCFVTNGRNVYYDIKEQPLCDVYGKVPGVRRPYIFETTDLLRVDEALKFVFMYTSEDELKRIHSIAAEGTMTFHAGRNLMEITTRELNKFSALKYLAALEGITPEEMVCIGDSENDISMLKGAGLGMAVKNAMENVQAHADVVSEKTNGEDGVAWLLEKYVLSII